MSRYTPDDEEAVRVAGKVRDWKESGLLDAARSAAIEGELRTGLRRTHWALRAVLFVFSASVIQSAVGFVFIVLKPDQPALTALLALAAGAGSFWIANLLVARYNLYRFGVEEACAVCSIVLIAGGVTLFASAAGVRGDWLAIVALVAAGFLCAFLYWWFGLLYTALIAAACAATVSFFLGLPEMWAHLLAAGVLLAVHVVAAVLRQKFDDEYPGDDYGVIESAALLGVYFLINLELPALFTGPPPAFPPAFFWGTFAAVWALPIAGLYRGIRLKHRWLIRASLVMLLGTLVTNKLYLGWERHTWDPILLGLLLAATALAVRRWLVASGEGHRHGFTPHRLLSSDQRTMAQVAFVAAALKPDDAVRETSPPSEPYSPGGGSSGGAGASGRF
jgi:uncharacterized membrane protein YgcG